MRTPTFCLMSCDLTGHRLYVEQADLEDVVGLLRKDVDHRKRRSKHFRRITGGLRGDANAKMIKKRDSLAKSLEGYLNDEKVIKQQRSKGDERHDSGHSRV